MACWACVYTKTDDDEKLDATKGTNALVRNLSANSLYVSFVVIGDPHPAAQRDNCYWEFDLANGNGIGPLMYVSNDINGACASHISNGDPPCQGIALVGDLIRGYYAHHSIVLYRSLYEYDHAFGAGDFGCWTGSAYPSPAHQIHYPVYPGLGNHDDPTNPGNSVDAQEVNDYIRDRVQNSDALYRQTDPAQPPVQNYYRDPNNAGDIFAYEWGSFHFINMGMWAFNGKFNGTNSAVDSDKITWLQNHLQAIGKEKAIVLLQHFGWDSFSFSGQFWSRQNAQLVADLICDRPTGTGSQDCSSPYNVIAIFTGHLHQFGETDVYLGLDQNNQPLYLPNYQVDTPGFDKDHNGYYVVWMNVYDGDNDGNGNLVGWMTVDQVDFEYVSNSGINYVYKRIETDAKYTRPLKTQYIRWDQGQPDNADGNEHCAAVKSNGRYVDLNCAILRPVLCHDEPSGYWTLNYASTPVSWYGGFNACFELGLTYTEPKNVADQSWVITVLQNAGISEAWVNYTDQYNGQWEEGKQVIGPR